MNNVIADVITPTDIYSEEYRQMVNTLPRAPRLEISESVKVRFRDWNTSKNCVTYRMCQINAHCDRRIDELVRNDVFTPNMRTIWTLTEPYVGMRSTEPQIIQARETHKSLKKIMLYIKEKLCKMVFADELRARREQEQESERERVRRKREAEEALSQRAIALSNQLGVNTINFHHPRITFRYVIENSRVVSRVVRYIRPPPPQVPFCNIENSLRIITEEEADKEMEDDCAICAFKHKMEDVCAINCGHQFGMDCLTHWNNIRINSGRPPVCPYCRTQITKIDKNSIATIDLSPVVL